MNGEFKCPRCGGPYFGRRYVLTNSRLVHCHCDKNGNAVSGTPDNFTRKEDYCGWKGDESECGFLERVIKLESPVECRGAQGLWDVPAEIAALIADAIPDDG